MVILLYLLLLAAGATAYNYTLQYAAQLLPIVPNKMANWSYNSIYWPDGKMYAYREDPSNTSSTFIINFVTDFRSRSPDQYVANISNPASVNNYNNPNRIDGSSSGVNTAELFPYNGTLLPPNQTGLFDDGAPIWKASKNVTFKNNSWLFNVFRLAETSQPGAAISKLIGFAHVEWTMGNCIYKWIGVRYSDDGIGWTYPVPIVTKDTMAHVCAPYTNATGGETNVGTGDMAVAWDPSNKRWVMLAQEGPLVMSVSTDAQAASGTWQRIDPTTGETRPGLIGGNDTKTLAHPDLSSHAGSNPSIIRDTKNGLWRMVWGQWGGALYASTTADLSRWSTPAKLNLTLNSTGSGDAYPGAGYPTLIGDGGDVSTSDGTAMLYFTDSVRQGKYKLLWAAPIKFS